MSTTHKVPLKPAALPSASLSPITTAASPRVGSPEVKTGLGNANAGSAAKALISTAGLAGTQAMAPDAIKNFAASVPDVVGQKNPLLAENWIVPKADEADVHTLRQDVFAESFDSLPSAFSSTRNAQARQSKKDILYEEGMELVNFLSLMVLKIIP